MLAKHNVCITGGKDKGDLLLILHALTFIVECLQFYNSVSAPNNVTINPPNKTAESYLKETRYKRPTIYKLAKSEGELKEIVRTKLKYFSEYNVAETTTHRNANKEKNTEDTEETKF
jgi:hypothetical protein